MKKIGIVTLYGEFNYGNRLQNYAVQEILSNYGNVETIMNCYKRPKWKIIPFYIKVLLKFMIHPYVGIKNIMRKRNFKKFSQYIIRTKKYQNIKNVDKNLNDSYDYFFVGSDQVWNHQSEIEPFFLLDFADNDKKNSFSASISRDSIDEFAKENAKKAWMTFNAISVRENSSKKLIEELIGRNDVVELLDPTMLIKTQEWDKVIKKPKMMDKFCSKDEKYIFNYFLGNVSDDYKKEIDRIAKINNCKTINILNPNDPFFTCGPSEFIWLEKNAFLICTDSFHSSVFAILYKKPFIVFNRDDGQIGKNSMNSRIENLLCKFDEENRYFNGKITNEMLKFNNKKIEKILKEEQDKAILFLNNALNINSE